MPASSFHATARLSRLTITSVCEDGATHRFGIGLDGTISNDFHDAEMDAVIRALGGEPHACGLALLAHEAAVDAFKAYAGVADNADAKFSGRRWKTEQTCDSCGRYPTLTHLNSLAHHVAVRGLTNFYREAGVIFRWLKRNHAEVQVPFVNFQEVTQAYGRHGDRRTSGYVGIVGAWSVTRKFMDSAHTVIGRNPSLAVQLRQRGVKVQWMNTLAESITARAAQKFREANSPESISTIIAGARNVDAFEVAGFLNAGIYANIYTYIKNHVTPEQAKMVWNASQGRKSLADLMRETGKTAAEIVAQVRRESGANAR